VNIYVCGVIWCEIMGKGYGSEGDCVGVGVMLWRVKIGAKKSPGFHPGLVWVVRACAECGVTFDFIFFGDHLRD
jgi:hypothetical protein